MTEEPAKYLDGDTLAAALRSGIHRVIGQQELLNRINVFPVADSDTGTNMALSLGSALGILNQPGEKHLGTLLAGIADALLDGSRGNSGAIAAQFFQGMSDAAGEITRFTTYTFSKAVSIGNEYAHDALSKPQEGTILSVISAFSESIRHQVNAVREGEFQPVIGEALERVDLDKIQFIGYAFQIEMKFAIYSLGFKIKEVPITFIDRVEGTSKMSMKIVRESIHGVLQLSLIHI